MQCFCIQVTASKPRVLVRLELFEELRVFVVIAVICNTDYAYTGDAIRRAKYDYRLTLGSGVTGTASTTTKWWN